MFDIDIHAVVSVSSCYRPALVPALQGLSGKLGRLCLHCRPSKRSSGWFVARFGWSPGQVALKSHAGGCTATAPQPGKCSGWPGRRCSPPQEGFGAIRGLSGEGSGGAPVYPGSDDKKTLGTTVESKSCGRFLRVVGPHDDGK